GRGRHRLRSVPARPGADRGRGIGGTAGAPASPLAPRRRGRRRDTVERGRVKVTVLGSGSAGNSILVEAGDTRILVDAGFSGRDIEHRLETVEVDPTSLNGIVITHEHGDHTRGMGVLARRFGIPLHLTPITREACATLLTGAEEVRTYSVAAPFR